MTWVAKPSGGYSVNSDNWKTNITQIYNTLTSYGWTIQAISGACGNFQSESGMNPWRWQDDSVSLTSDNKGYGICQWTPAKGYIYGYGVGVQDFAPNLSVTSVTSGSSPDDGNAQLYVIDTNKSGKFLNRTRYCDYADISSLYPLSNYKQADDLWLATVGWLYHFEFPAKQYRDYNSALARYNNTIAVYNYLESDNPNPPTPPDPPDPPVPPEPSKTISRMKIYEYPNFKRRLNLWL